MRTDDEVGPTPLPVQTKGELTNLQVKIRSHLLRVAVRRLRTSYYWWYRIDYFVQ